MPKQIKDSPKDPTRLHSGISLHLAFGTASLLYFPKESALAQLGTLKKQKTTPPQFGESWGGGGVLSIF